MKGLLPEGEVGQLFRGGVGAEDQKEVDDRGKQADGGTGAELAASRDSRYLIIRIPKLPSELPPDAAAKELERLCTGLPCAAQWLETIAGEYVVILGMEDSRPDTGRIGRQLRYQLSSCLKAYVDEHYCSSCLSLKELCQHFGMSESMVSKTFKAEAGENFYQYLTRKRMARAKELLLSRCYDVQTIAAMTGYESRNSFTRAFIRSEGVKLSEFVTQSK